METRRDFTGTLRARDGRRAHGLLAALCLMPCTAQAQQVEAQRLATLMAYCVSAIVSNNVDVSNKPVGVKTKGRSATWSAGGNAALHLQQIAGHWECALSAESQHEMARAAKGVLRGIKGAQVTTQKWRKGGGEAVLASACVAGKRITMIANGPIAEAGKYGFTRITDKFGKLQPC